MGNAPRTFTRIVPAPPPSPASANVLPNRVISAEVAEDEEVQWIWSSTSDGVSYVSGYRILKRPEVTGRDTA
jgi:hypothetical protein